MLANDFDDDKLQHYYPSQASDRSWSVLGSQDISDRHHGLSTYVPASFPEPEFVPSITSSTKDFLYETFKYERKNDNDITGRPNEYIDNDCSDCPPPSSDLDQSALNSQVTITQSKTESNSWGIGYVSNKSQLQDFIFTCEAERESDDPVFGAVVKVLRKHSDDSLSN
ncbi:10433_t:CDS:2, partial [Racocetra fulgida]